MKWFPLLLETFKSIIKDISRFICGWYFNYFPEKVVHAGTAFIKVTQSWNKWSGTRGKGTHRKHVPWHRFLPFGLRPVTALGMKSPPRPPWWHQWAHRVGTSCCSSVACGGFHPPFVGCDAFRDLLLFYDSRFLPSWGCTCSIIWFVNTNRHILFLFF